MQGRGDLELAKKGLGVDDSFLSMFLFCLLVLEVIAAPAVACLDTGQTIKIHVSCYIFICSFLKSQFFIGLF